ncbi:DNA/RNA non-specific endonuclease [Aeoliella mucimassa]|uniref:DNA/RNA non-specific endonuclease n=1 Tax=Aeoliella mucimassa TaxID=2527972 RepID=A0A518ALD4_9BACT|nr:DNA/RNA non-specific endonuclease [Aeoliella mucimassa]QDU55537.1 DNA/RNA non-specific endonuclease [Aeoliella mucimassa]
MPTISTCICGAAQNLDAERPIQILVNQGYVVGFSPERLQPAWSAYRVAHADADVDYDRPLVYYDDMRLPEEHRIGRKTFGKIGGIQLNVGHMSPNEVINRQFGRLAQLETFLMSNMSPQYASLNSGVWLKQETAIRNIEDGPGKDHVWAIAGPVFDDQPSSINRGHGKYLPVPTHYYYITVDPHQYPYDTPSRVIIDCFLIPQTAPRDSNPLDYRSSLNEIEGRTKLKFFRSWGRELPMGVLASTDEPIAQESRLTKVLKTMQAEEAMVRAAMKSDYDDIDSIQGLIDELKDQAAQIRNQGYELVDSDLEKLQTLQHTISWLVRARGIASETAEPEQPESTLITYHVVDDMDGKLDQAARTACNFWNRFVEPKQSIVIRLGTFHSLGNTIARAYFPYENDGVMYGRVEFNTRFLATFTEEEIAGTIVHEIGHTLGIGWERWETLFDKDTGLFNPKAIRRLSELQFMEVERDGGSGTALAHWDELKFDKELMTGYKDPGEHVLPVTIDLMKILGHKVLERLDQQTPLSDLLVEAASMMFSRQDEAQSLNLEHFEETGLMETIPHM